LTASLARNAFGTYGWPQLHERPRSGFDLTMDEAWALVRTEAIR
jgi:hypothetical protein